MTAPFTVSHLRAEDRNDWQGMWEVYNGDRPHIAFDQAVVTSNWNAIMQDDGRLSALALRAESTDQAIGFAHYLFHHSTNSVSPECYLKDFYVSPAHRGKGGGTILLEGVLADCHQRGLYRLTWITQPDNIAACRLYDKIAQGDNWVRYVAMLKGTDVDQPRNLAKSVTVE